MKPLLGSSGTRLQESRLQLAGERHRVWSEAILGQVTLFAAPPGETQLYSVLYDRLGWLLVGPRSIFGGRVATAVYLCIGQNMWV